MFFSEEELSVQVRIFDMIWIGKGDFAVLSSAQTNHGEVLQQLAANGTGSNHEQFCVFNYV